MGCKATDTGLGGWNLVCMEIGVLVYCLSNLVLSYGIKDAFPDVQC